jgi:hypothetical protein
MSFGGFFRLFDTDQFIQGNISVPTDAAGAFAEGMQVSLTPAQPQNFSFDEVSLRDMSISVGVRYTPKLSKFKPLFSVNATGAISFLGVNVNIDQMEVDFANGGMAAVLFRTRANLALPGIKTAEAAFEYVWVRGTPATTTPKPTPAKPASISVSASAVFVTDSGFAIGTAKNPAKLEYKSGKCIIMSGQVIVPGILDATVSGYLITGAPCLAETIQMGDIPGAEKTILSEVPLPLKPGDWRFDASNVKITIAGFSAAGNFTIGKMYGVPYGSIDATLHLNTSATKNTMYVKGSIDPLRGVKIQGEADLEVAGIVSRFKIDAALTSTDQYISAEAELTIQSVKFLVAGSFGVRRIGNSDYPTMSFSASIPNFTLGGYNLGTASIQIEQNWYSANISVALNVKLGVIRFFGNASLHWAGDGIALSLNAIGSMGTEKWGAVLSVHFSNCGNNECTTPGPFSLIAKGAVFVEGFQLNLGTLSIDSSGHFSYRVSMSAESCSYTGNILDLGFAFQGCFNYTISAVISDTAPYASLDTNVSLRVDFRERKYPANKPNYWGSWSTVLNIYAGISIQLSPFKLSIRTKVYGWPVSFEI